MFKGGNYNVTWQSCDLMMKLYIKCTKHDKAYHKLHMIWRIYWAPYDIINNLQLTFDSGMIKTIL